MARLSHRITLIAVACVTAILISQVFLWNAPRASALSDACVPDSNSLISNGSMAAADPDNGVAACWNSFTISGAPFFEHVDNEQIDPNGSQYLWDDAATFDAGIYQTVSNLTPGSSYRFWLGYALAAYDPGDMVNHRGDWIGRQVGVDATGGTDPLSGGVTWSSLYCNGVAALNIPALNMTFSAQSNRATIFLRAVNFDTNYRNKVWFDAVAMQPAAALHIPLSGSNLIFLPFVLRSPPPAQVCP